MCEEQVKDKKRLGWKHGNTPRRFLIGIQRFYSFSSHTNLKKNATEIPVSLSDDFILNALSVANIFEFGVIFRN